MVSKTDLANMALVRLGKARLTDIDLDTTEEAVVANLFFDEIRDEVLDEGPWAFSIKRACLAQLGTTPEYEFDYEFQLPNDCLRLIGIDELIPGTIEHTVEGRKLLANDTSVEILYISQVSDVSLWAASFKRAFIIRLAAEMSYTFRADHNLTQVLFSQYQDAMERGLATDGKQGSNQTIVSSDLIEVR